MSIKTHIEKYHPDEKPTFKYIGPQELNGEVFSYFYDCSICQSTLSVKKDSKEDVDYLEELYNEGRVDRLPEGLHDRSLVSDAFRESKLLDNPVRQQNDPETDEHKSLVLDDDERGDNPFLRSEWESSKNKEDIEKARMSKKSIMKWIEVIEKLPPEDLKKLLEMEKNGDYSGMSSLLRDHGIDEVTISAIMSGQIRIGFPEGSSESAPYSQIDTGLSVSKRDEEISKTFHERTNNEIWDIASGRILASPDDVEVARDIISRGLIASKKKLPIMLRKKSQRNIYPGMEGITYDNKKVLVLDYGNEKGEFKVNIDGEGTDNLTEDELRSSVKQWWPGIYYSRKNSYKEGEKVKTICGNAHFDEIYVKERPDRLCIVKNEKTGTLAVVYWDQIYVPLEFVRANIDTHELQMTIHDIFGVVIDSSELADLRDKLESLPVGGDVEKTIYNFLKEKNHDVSYYDKYTIGSLEKDFKKSLGVRDIHGDFLEIGDKVIIPGGETGEVTNVNPLIGVSVKLEGGRIDSFRGVELIKKID